MTGAGPGPGAERPDPHVSGSTVYRDLLQIGNVQGNVTIAQGGPPTAPEQIVEGDIPQQPPGFQPREDLLRRLHEQVAAEGAAVICALTGLPGVGKTTLAASYAWACQHAGWPLIAWIAAENENQILAGLAALAHRLGICGADDDSHAAATRAKHRLAGSWSPALLVFDNAVDPDLVRRWCPATGMTRVIITSRNTAFGRLHTPVHIEEFTPEEALLFLRRRTGLSDDSAAANLASELGHLPLALSQAASVIARRHVGYSEYLHLLTDFPLEEHLPHQDGDVYPHGTAQAILLSVTQAEAGDEDTWEALGVLAVLSPAGIPRALFRDVVDDPADRARLDEILAGLADHSLITFTEDGTTILMHRLIQRVLRERARHEDNLAGILDTATQLLSAFNTLIPEGAETWNARAAVEALLEQTDALYAIARAEGRISADLLTLRHWSGRYLIDLADPGRAITLLEVTVTDFQNVLGRDHPDTLINRATLVLAYLEAGLVDLAITLNRESLADQERILGSDHPETLRTRSNLALAYQTAGQLDLAIGLHQSLLADEERIFGPHRLETLRTRNNLAVAYQTAGQLDLAIGLYQSLLADQERIFGPHHPETLRTRNNLALAYNEAGQSTQTIALYQSLLADQERILGPHHPETLRTRNNLAGAYRELGQYAQAVTLNRENLSECERILGPDHPLTLTARSNLANSYLDSGRFDLAFTLLQTLLADQERILGPHHPDILTTRNNLATAYLEAGQIDLAIVLYESTLADCEQVLSTDHPLTGLLRENLDLSRDRATRENSWWLRVLKRIRRRTHPR
ncbi:FxSxx-COOH system tetratricopeptide repeat protein [Rhizohabitans arisaemae]|uniref:FxSxx-COOH system tetratricopeptide repeat protein n=1 Tax=Rhizohabitans arisaemae TaxID=2720610 RepID=UPI0024B1657C|nr:FxSxx-COOH system tetratricopeptide repeat protein [Rhizohabitans arisaemae]